MVELSLVAARILLQLIGESSINEGSLSTEQQDAITELRKAAKQDLDDAVDDALKPKP